MLYSLVGSNSNQVTLGIYEGTEVVAVPFLIPAGEAAAAVGSATFYLLLVSVAVPFLANNDK